jgi:tripartite-type tricarboxylate transporter receptor subunit TctC
MKQAGIKMRHVPYAGAGQSVPDLVGRRIDLLVGSPTAVDPAIKSGKGVKYIAVTSKDRFPSLPDVLSVSETLPGYDQPAAMGLMVIKGTPPQVTALLNQTIAKILTEPEVKKTMIEVVGGMPVGGSVELFNNVMVKQRAARGPLLQELGLTGPEKK